MLFFSGRAPGWRRSAAYSTPMHLFIPRKSCSALRSISKDDQQPYNASQTIRLFLLLGSQSRPTLEATLNSPDQQARSFAKATIDALQGNHRAFGYLDARIDLTDFCLDNA